MTATPWGMAAKASRPKCTHAKRMTTKFDSGCYTLTRDSLPVRVKAFVEHRCSDCAVEWITRELEN